MDDDDDKDGIINLNDATNTLSSQDYSYESRKVITNPVQNGLLEFPSSVAINNIFIYDISGKEIKLTPINKNLFDVSAFQNGVYLVKTEVENKIYTQKILIQK